MSLRYKVKEGSEKEFIQIQTVLILFSSYPSDAGSVQERIPRFRRYWHN